MATVPSSNMSRPLEGYQAYLPLDFQIMPLTNTGLVLAIIAIIFSLDYVNYTRQRKKLSGLAAIIGDAPYLSRRLRWTEKGKDLRDALQHGYNTVTVQCLFPTQGHS
jgi:hypothetical protein